MRPCLARAGDVTALLVNAAWRHVPHPTGSGDLNNDEMNCLALECLRFGSYLLPLISQMTDSNPVSCQKRTWKRIKPRHKQGLPDC